MFPQVSISTGTLWPAEDDSRKSWSVAFLSSKGRRRVGTVARSLGQRWTYYDMKFSATDAHLGLVVLSMGLYFLI